MPNVSWTVPSAEVAAEFTATLKDVEGNEGQDVELECILNKPNVEVRWLKNKKPLTPSDRIKIVCDRYRHYLRIMDTIPEDEGEYTAVLPSKRESSANLKIYGMDRAWVYCVPLTEYIAGSAQYRRISKNQKKKMLFFFASLWY